jgi:hypothetical protein
MESFLFTIVYLFFIHGGKKINACISFRRILRWKPKTNSIKLDIIRNVGNNIISASNLLDYNCRDQEIILTFFKDSYMNFRKYKYNTKSTISVWKIDDIDHIYVY